MIQVNNLSLAFAETRLFNEIAFHVQKGEYLAILGPNGAGKTTLLRILDGMERDWIGEVLFLGHRLQSYSRKQIARSIAYVQQFGAIPFSFTTRQIVEMGRYPHLKPLAPLDGTDLEIINTVMTDMEVLQFADRSIETLSGGERQRVFLAAALAQNPDVLFLDEPTTYLDYKHQNELSGRLRKINRERNVTIVEVTHDVNRALINSTHLIALCNGRVAFDGQPDDLLKNDVLEQIYGSGFCRVEHPEEHRLMVLPSAGL